MRTPQEDRRETRREDKDYAPRCPKGPDQPALPGDTDLRPLARERPKHLVQGRRVEALPRR